MTPPAFDPDSAWDVHPQVSVRPEPFGALLYHFGTRRLSFLKDRTLLAVVQDLGQRPSARDAFVSAGVDDVNLPRYTRALATLAASQMIVERSQVTQRGADRAEWPTQEADERVRSRSQIAARRQS